MIMIVPLMKIKSMLGLYLRQLVIMYVLVMSPRIIHQVLEKNVTEEGLEEGI